MNTELEKHHDSYSINIQSLAQDININKYQQIF